MGGGTDSASWDCWRSSLAKVTAWLAQKYGSADVKTYSSFGRNSKSTRCMCCVRADDNDPALPIV